MTERNIWDELLFLATCLLVVFSIVVLLMGCTSVVEPEDVVDPTDLVGIAEQYCKSDPTLTCGKVYQFNEVPAENPLGLLEMCVTWPDHPDRPSLAQAETEFGPSMLSTDPRFENANLCWWQCPTARGCNSYSGCYCWPEMVTSPVELPVHVRRAMLLWVQDEALD